MIETEIIIQMGAGRMQRIVIMGVSIVISLAVSLAAIYIIHKMLNLLDNPPDLQTNSPKENTGNFSAVILYLLVLVIITELTLLGAERLANLILETIYGTHHEIATITKILGMKSGPGPLLILTGIFAGLLALVAILETVESYISPMTEDMRRKLEEVHEEMDTG